MFDFLKKKISDFVGTLTRKEESAVQEEAKGQIPETQPAPLPKQENAEEARGQIQETQPTPLPNEKGSPDEAVDQILVSQPTPTDEEKGGKEEAMGLVPESPLAQLPEEKGGKDEAKGQILGTQPMLAVEEKASEPAPELISKEEPIGPKAGEAKETPMTKAAAERILEELETTKPFEKWVSEAKAPGMIEAKQETEEQIIKENQAAQIAQKVHEKGGKDATDLKKVPELLEQAQKVIPKSPEKIAREKEKMKEREIAPDSMEDEHVEEEIEELVGGTMEGEIRKEAQRAEKRIIDEKKKEEISRKVFSSGKEEFLAAGKERELKPRVGFFSQIKGLFTGEVEIKQQDVSGLFEQLELALLESDVSFATAHALISDLKIRLVGRKVKTGRIEEEVKREIAFALASVLQSSRSDFLEKVKAAKAGGSVPFIVMFLGPNGMGKTTTIAKVAHKLKKQGISSVISASDTFRAAAIEQAEHHGTVLGVRVVKHKYGADPAAVAFDAVNHARAHKVDVVLIDTAGRQDTNLNLLSEMQKIVRIVKPNLKVFVAEAIAGTSLIGQVKTFNEKLGLDGIVLTKLDCDAKGGGTLSIAYECKLPVYFVGTGQEYDDLLEFNEEWIVKNIIAE